METDGYSSLQHSQAVQVKLFVDELCSTNKLKGVKYTYWEESRTSKVCLKVLN